MAHVLSSAFYLPGSYVPEIFLEADRQWDEAHKNEPKAIREVVEVPMPFIHENKGKSGPIIITEDWALKKRKKELKRRAEDAKEMQIEMMQLISKRDYLKLKLGELDPGRKKDAKKIVSINVQLKDIEADLRMLQEQSGINLNELDHGSRLARFVGRVKRWFKRKIKKIKKIFEENKELIVGMIAIIAPTVFTAVIKSLAARA